MIAVTVHAKNVVERHLQAAKDWKVNVKIVGWKGSRKIPKKDLEAFRKDLKAAVPEAGFEVLLAGGPHAQVKESQLPKLETVLKKHGLRKEGKPEKAKRALDRV